VTRNPQLSTRNTGFDRWPTTAPLQKGLTWAAATYCPLGEIGQRPSHFCNSASAFFTFCASALSGLSFRYAS